MNPCKHIYIYTIIIIYFLLTGIPGMSQVRDVAFEKENFPKEDREKLYEAIKNIKKGDKFYEFGSRATYIQALEYYLPANDFNPSNAELLFKIGNSYLYSLNKSRAAFFLEKAYSINPKISPEIKFLLGEAYFFNQDIDKAVSYYKDYLKDQPKDAPEDRIAGINKKLKLCDVARQFMKAPECYIIENLGSTINTVFPEYAPVITADESKMLFTSCRDNTLGGERDPVDLFFYEDIYISPKMGNEEWSVPLHPGSPLNSNYHDATVGLSPDGQRLLMYRGDNGGDLFESRQRGDGYGEPVRLPKPVNSSFHESSASYSPDQNTIYFVSDRPGGIGGHDIYSCTRDKNNRWGDAVNLGPVINTERDETGVFMHPDGKTLYFSSQGHVTMGGFDFFSSTFENGKWSEPRNLGYPLNTTDDDVFIVISADGRHGYFASYRAEGLGEKDIYRVTFLGGDKPLVDNNEDNLLASIIEPFKHAQLAPTEIRKSSQLTLLKGNIYDADKKTPLDASIDITNNNSNELVNSFDFKGESGDYLVALPSGHNYGIAVKAEGYLFHSENMNIPENQGYMEQVKDIPMDKVGIGKKIILRNIFFDVDRSDIRPESRGELGQLILLLKELPSLHIEITGHTDNTGTLEHNLELSEKRAREVVLYLVANGIDMKRLSYSGKGFSQPLTHNETEEARQSNRRIEVTILAK
jgi:outer membrane protein OmpA-like peptidoglycan-associated protein